MILNTIVLINEVFDNTVRRLDISYEREMHCGVPEGNGDVCGFLTVSIGLHSKYVRNVRFIQYKCLFITHTRASVCNMFTSRACFYYYNYWTNVIIIIIIILTIITMIMIKTHFRCYY